MSELNYTPDPRIDYPRRGDAPALAPTKETYRNIDVDEAGFQVTNRPTKIAGYYLFNTTASIVYVKFYDQLLPPVVGTDTPVMTIPLPASTGANMYDANGLRLFEYGIGIAGTTGVADNDTGAPSANAIVANIFYS